MVVVRAGGPGQPRRSAVAARPAGSPGAQDLQPLTIKEFQDDLGMFRVSLVAAMCHTLLPKRRHMLPALEKARPTFQEARPDMFFPEVGFRHGSGTPFRPGEANIGRPVLDFT